MQKLKLGWHIVIALAALTIHALIIDAWIGERNHNVPIGIISIILTCLLAIATLFLIAHKKKYLDAYIWSLLFWTTLIISVGATTSITLWILAIIWGCVIIVYGIVGLIIINRWEMNPRLDNVTFFYIMSLLVAVGSSVILSITHDIWFVAIGLIVVICTSTFIFSILTYRNTHDRTIIAFALLTAALLVSAALTCLLTNHQVPLLLINFILHFCAWGALWIISDEQDSRDTLLI